MTNGWLPRTVSETGYRFGHIPLANKLFARLDTNLFMMASRGLHHTGRTLETEVMAAAWLLDQR